jgi:hypothetical protein
VTSSQQASISNTAQPATLIKARADLIKTYASLLGVQILQADIVENLQRAAGPQ